MASNTANIVPGEWIVKLKPYATNEVRAMHMNLVNSRNADPTPFNAQIHHEYNLPEARGYSASFNETTKREIEQQAEVESVEPVRLFHHCRAVKDTKNVPWGLDRVSHYNKVSPRPPYTYEYNDESAGQGVIVYVIDTGINDKHVEFEGRAKKGPVFVTTRQKTSTEDVDGHGTHCAGTIGSKTYGVAKKVDIVGVKVFVDSANAGARTDDIIRAIQYVVDQSKVTRKPSVINLSLGGDIDNMLDAAVMSAIHAGVIVCYAARNGRPGVSSPPS